MKARTRVFTTDIKRCSNHHLDNESFDSRVSQYSTLGRNGASGWVERLSTLSHRHAIATAVGGPPMTRARIWPLHIVVNRPASSTTPLRPLPRRLPCLARAPDVGDVAATAARAQIRPGGSTAPSPRYRGTQIDRGGGPSHRHIDQPCHSVRRRRIGPRLCLCAPPWTRRRRDRLRRSHLTATAAAQWPQPEPPP